MSANIGLTLSSTKFEIAGGESEEITLVVRNQSQIVDHYTVTVEGLDPTWWTLTVPTFSLFPNDQGEAKITIHPAKDAEAKAGGYSFHIKATSKADPMDCTTVDALLVLGRFLFWEADMSPTKITGKSGTYRITLNNSGNADVVIMLEARDPEEGLLYQFNNSRVTVPAGGSTRVTLIVKPKEGEQKKQYNFQVLSRSVNDKGPARDIKMLNGQLEYRRGKLPWWIIPIIVLLLAAAAAAWFLVPAPSEKAAVTVTFPKGGDKLPGGSTQVIKWTTTGSGIVYTDVEYSLTGGAPWTSIVADKTGATDHNWTVPDSGSTNCYVRVIIRDAKKVILATNQNDSAFTISQSTNTVTVTSPKGGETWVAGSVHPITWTKIGSGISYIDIQYSLTGGAPWTNIITDVPSGNSYNWTVPNSGSTNCYVKVIARNAGKTIVAEDTSDSAFTISQSTNTVTVTSPKGGETWVAGSVHPITWTKIGSGISYIDIQYSLTGGAPWTNIITDVPSGNSYNWTVPNSGSTNCYVKVIARNAGKTVVAEDTSDSVFTITLPLPTVTVVLPNGGETWTGGTPYTITWTTTGSGFVYIDVEYSLTGGAPWTPIATDKTNITSWSWKLPNPSPNRTNCYVKVTLKNINKVVLNSDTNNSPFNINHNILIETDKKDADQK